MRHEIILVMGFVGLFGISFSSFASSAMKQKQSRSSKDVLKDLGFSSTGIAKKCFKDEKNLEHLFKGVKNLGGSEVDWKVFYFIFEENPHLFKVRNKMGWTLLHDAAHEGNLDLCKKLIFFGLDMYAETEAVGDTPLHLAVRLHAWDVIKFLYFSNYCEERKNELGAYPFDHECSCCPQEYLDLAKECKELK
ncbi:hypothetical protein COB28_04550 [Candidatus Dependentiae bacterium]|nr:MAG: hypothetical protein COB28_04550 [Candidatus Dependentiae bacterium]